MSADDSHAVVFVWEFCVNAERRHDFEQAYGPNGDWAQLFRSERGYIRTELHHDAKSPDLYVTLDFWDSKRAFENFKQTHALEYKALDEKCESLTQQETFVGEFATWEQARARLSLRGFVLAEEFSIRPATVADVPAMISLEISAPQAAHWSKRAYEQMFNPETPRRIVLAATIGQGALCGFAIVRISSGECELENIVVGEKHRRSGIGRALLQALVATAGEEPMLRMLLEVRESNHAARGLYESCGFSISNRRKRYYSGPTEDALIYALAL